MKLNHSTTVLMIVAILAIFGMKAGTLAQAASADLRPIETPAMPPNAFVATPTAIVPIIQGGDSGFQNFYCNVLNVGRFPVLVNIQAFGGPFGDLINSLLVSLLPNTEGILQLQVRFPNEHATYWCRFSFSGASTDLRANMQIQSDAPGVFFFIDAR